MLKKLGLQQLAHIIGSVQHKVRRAMPLKAIAIGHTTGAEFEFFYYAFDYLPLRSS